MSDLPSKVDVAPDCAIDWYYPNIYKRDPATGEPTRLSRLCINMMHTRASNDFTVEYDSDRDGFVIRTDRVMDGEDGMETVEEDVEVAFIPAWLETK